MTRKGFFAAIAALFVGIRAARAQQAPVTMTLTPRRDTWTDESQAYQFAQRAADNTLILVYYNGLLMTEGFDYTLSPDRHGIEFHGQEITAGCIVNALYYTT